MSPSLILTPPPPGQGPPPVTPKAIRVERAKLRLPACILFVAWLLCLALALTSPVDRDEHMYQAAGALLGKARIYQDFAFFQPPYAAWLHGAVQRLTPGMAVLLPARIAKALLAAVLLLILYRLLRRLGADGGTAALLVLLLMHCAVVRGMIGLARNYDAPQAALLGALLLVPFSGNESCARGRHLAAGALAGLALGLKLIQAPLALLVVAWPLISPVSDAPRRRGIAWTLAGLGCALLPAAIALLAIDWARIRFNLLDYHWLNAAWHQQEALGRGHDLAGKLRDAWLMARRSDHAALLGLALLTAALRWQRRASWHLSAPGRLAALYLAAALVMVAVPRPVQDAYYAPLLFGAALWVAAACRQLTGRRLVAARILLAAACLVAVVHHAAETRHLLTRAARPAEWPAWRLHLAGRRLAGLMADHATRMVLTTHPLYVLEAGHVPVPELAAGEFGWRLSHVLSPPQAQRFRLAGPAGLDALAAADPGAIVLEVASAPWDRPLGDWARRQDRRPVALLDDVFAWLPPGP